MRGIIVSLIVLLGAILPISSIYSQDVRGKGVGEVPKEEKKKPVQKKNVSSNVWIQGKVIDKATGKGIPNVTIDIVDLSRGLGLTRKVTNSSGSFVIYPIKGAEGKTLNLIIQNYQNLPPLNLPITPQDRKVIIYKSGNSWSWTKE